MSLRKPVRILTKDSLPKRAYKREEASLVKACLEYLRLDGHLALRNNSGIIYLRDGFSPRAVRVGMPGSSDIIGCTKNGRFFAVECKSKNGKLTKHQAEFLEKVKSLGGIALVVRSVDELMEFFG